MNETEFISILNSFPFKFQYEIHALLNGEFLGIATHENVKIYYQSGLPENANPWRMEVYYENTFENLNYEATDTHFINLFIEYHNET